MFLISQCQTHLQVTPFHAIYQTEAACSLHQPSPAHTVQPGKSLAQPHVNRNLCCMVLLMLYLLCHYSMPVSRNTGVFVPVTAPITGRLAH